VNRVRCIAGLACKALKNLARARPLKHQDYGAHYAPFVKARQEQIRRGGEADVGNDGRRSESSTRSSLAHVASRGDGLALPMGSGI
jgi:hypothetical protein